MKKVLGSISRKGIFGGEATKRNMSQRGEQGLLEYMDKKGFAPSVANTMAV